MGEVLNNRYQSTTKIDYGVASTVWLTRDLRYASSASQYVVLKIHTHGSERDHELNVYEHINLIQTDHPGKTYIRKLLGHFYTKGPHGRHSCLVHHSG
ncbi:kinase-like domain-containing protein [Penicillium alfredii]|uniref:non-specific serine/threonine protein kinase n=1 Tax=Penicillium alfredii TaxID=1506179 RepID=A0A9W9FR48_9EURO|nr:kinase-like domain-containing protein [Penicillium alfredii]KAJ5104860.1 kinase-like domain-containing protein [Penicillium alfredii]